MHTATRLSLMSAALAVVAAAAWVVDAARAPAIEAPYVDETVHRVVVTAPRAVADEPVVHRVEISATRLHPEATLTAEAASPQPRAL